MASGTGTGLTGQAMYGSSQKSKGGWSTQEPTIYLVALVVIEAAVLLGLRVGFKEHHGG